MRPRLQKNERRLKAISVETMHRYGRSGWRDAVSCGCLVGLMPVKSW